MFPWQWDTKTFPMGTHLIIIAFYLKIKTTIAKTITINPIMIGKKYLLSQESLFILLKQNKAHFP